MPKRNNGRNGGNGFEIAHKVTPNCFIDTEGRVVFMREMDGERKPVVLATIHDAISQCFHIMDRIKGEAVDFYNTHPTIHSEGEQAEMREIFLQLQSAIAAISSKQSMSEQETAEIRRGFDRIVQKLGAISDKHKRWVSAYLQDSRTSGKPLSAGEILAPAKAHLEAVTRFSALIDIAKGVTVQARRLLEIALESEERLRRVYEFIVEYEHRVRLLFAQIEDNHHRAGVRCLPAHVRVLRDIADEVAKPEVNKVINALKGIVPVEPYKSRVESPDVQCLTHLYEYLERWETGEDVLPTRFANAFKRARTKIKRVVRTTPAQADKRMFEAHYEKIGGGS